MTLSSAERSELNELLAALREKRIDSKQSARLNRYLRENAASRRLYLEHFYLASMLRWLHDDLTAEPAAAPTAEPVPAKSLSRKAPPVRRLSYGWSRVLVAACFYGAFALLALNLRSDLLPPGVDNAPNDSTGVAMVSDSADVMWSAEGRPSASDATIRQGEPLQIESGLVELKLKQGTTLLVEGPAQWSIDGENRATLKRGKLVASVPREAIGFTLQTPTARVVDLGTKFGVYVGSSGVTEVNVQSGVVECGARIKPASPMRLMAGETVRILETGQVVSIDGDPDQFATLTNASSGPIAKTAQDKSRLLVYEPFTESRDGVALHHRHDGEGFRGIEWVAPETIGAEGIPAFCLRNDIDKGPLYFPGNVPFKGTPGVFEYHTGEPGSARATRKMVDSVNLAQDREYYLSFVAFKFRNDTRGMVGLWNRDADQGIEAGWTYSGGAGADPFAVAGPGVEKSAVAPESQLSGDAKPVFFVVRIVASADKPDVVFLKAYRTESDTAHNSSTELAGEGPARDQWTVVLPPFSSNLVLDQLTLSAGGPHSYIHVDEIRVGTTWQSVTGVP